MDVTCAASPQILAMKRLSTSVAIRDLRLIERKKSRIVM
jgi:hypothetical protein